MKKIVTISISFFLIALLCFNNLIIYNFLNYTHKSQFKKELKQKNIHSKIIEINPCELYTDTKEICWKDGNTELEINGEMYDIVDIKNKGKIISIKIIKDDVQNNLLKNYVNNLDSDLSKTSKQKSKNQKMFFGFKVTAQVSFFELLPNVLIHLINHSPINSLQDGYTSINIPPPLV